MMAEIAVPQEAVAFESDALLAGPLKEWLSQKANIARLSEAQSTAVGPLLEDLAKGKLILKSTPRDSDTRNDSGRLGCYFKEDEFIIELHSNMTTDLGIDAMEALSLYRAMNKRRCKTPAPV